MQTSLPEQYRLSSSGRRAEDILRSCVHCGFCNATCPTYQLLGDELDGPRGRIYLIKEMLEQQEVTGTTITHLDRCLTCRACETTCPSGVQYGELLEIGREFAESRFRRSFFQRLQRGWLKKNVPDPVRFDRWAHLGRMFRWLLPWRLRRQLPARHADAAARKEQPDGLTDGYQVVAGRVLLLDGCVQRIATPQVNDALRKLLGDRDIEVLSSDQERCCGGLALHLGDEGAALESARANLRGLSEHLDGVDAVISTASGCGVTLQDYGRLLDPDEPMAGAARELCAKFYDISEYLSNLGGSFDKREDVHRVALHVPCTLQHGQRGGQQIAAMLTAAGYQLVEVRDSHLCCGSAGTYSILQPDLSDQLRAEKLQHLQADGPDVIATANVGCQTHMDSEAEVPVIHWLELLN